jgi:signal peptide peptidase SppA
MALKDILEKMAQKTIEDIITQGQKTPENDNEGAKVAVLTLSGAIMGGGGGAGGFGGNQPLNIDSVKPKLEAIAKMKDVKAIALDINSPGGSPYHSRAIADAIRTTAAEMGVPVHGFVAEVAASGGYWLACAADDIYVAPESIVGSIGVVSAGFGFDKAIEKLGVERRVYTAGKSKVTNDPFQPENEEGLKKANELREKIHDNFIGWGSVSSSVFGYIGRAF